MKLETSFINKIGLGSLRGMWALYKVGCSYSMVPYVSRRRSSNLCLFVHLDYYVPWLISVIRISAILASLKHLTLTSFNY